MNEYTNDPARDARLREALGSLDPLPAAEVDWNRLRTSVAARAELPLARRRRGQRERLRWMRPVVPAAAAAGLALVVATQMFQPGSNPALVAGNDVPADFHPVVEQVLGTEISEFELDLLFGQVDADQLAVAAVGRR
jgi:hypothetical protein